MMSETSCLMIIVVCFLWVFPSVICQVVVGWYTHLPIYGVHELVVSFIMHPMLYSVPCIGWLQSIFNTEDSSMIWFSHWRQIAFAADCCVHTCTYGHEVYSSWSVISGGIPWQCNYCLVSNNCVYYQNGLSLLHSYRVAKSYSYRSILLEPR